MRLKIRRTLVLLILFSLSLIYVFIYFLSFHDCGSSRTVNCIVSQRRTGDNRRVCNLPRLTPFTQSVKQLVKNYSDDVSLYCGTAKKIFNLINGRLEIQDPSQFANIFKQSVKYESVIRPKRQDNLIEYSDRIPVYPAREGRKIPSDFVKVGYKLRNGKRKVEIFAQIVEKQDVFRRREKLRFLRNTPNVVLMGFDSTSNANFKRMLRKSYQYLTDKLRAYVFNGYVIVGDGTTAALTAILTGKPVESLTVDNRTDLESWPWIMKTYKRAGYVTLYAEDDPRIGGFITLGSFDKAPADHYTRPLWLAVERQGLNGRRRGSSSSWIRGVCLDSEPLHNITLNYVEDFLSSYRDVPKFAFPFFSYLPHGTGEKLSLADKDLHLFLKRYEKHRNNTILIIFGDHGARVGALRNTLQGSYEEHLPWLSVVLPPWFEMRYPELTMNLRVNQDRLVSPFDLHHTLRHILRLDKPPPVNSLMAPVDPGRSCKEAGVTDEHWCPCLQWRKEEVDIPAVKRAAGVLVEHINRMISKRQIFINLCFTVYLVDIILAARADAVGEMQDTGVVYYQVTISTEPGKGIFQATFRLYADNTMKMTTHISRTSMYGRNPWCLGKEHHNMRKFCTCKESYKRVQKQ